MKVRRQAGDQAMPRRPHDEVRRADHRCAEAVARFAAPHRGAQVVEFLLHPHDFVERGAIAIGQQFELRPGAGQLGVLELPAAFNEGVRIGFVAQPRRHALHQRQAALLRPPCPCLHENAHQRPRSRGDEQRLQPAQDCRTRCAGCQNVTGSEVAGKHQRRDQSSGQPGRGHAPHSPSHLMRPCGSSRGWGSCSS